MDVTKGSSESFSLGLGGESAMRCDRSVRSYSWTARSMPGMAGTPKAGFERNLRSLLFGDCPRRAESGQTGSRQTESLNGNNSRTTEDRRNPFSWNRNDLRQLHLRPTAYFSACVCQPGGISPAHRPSMSESQEIIGRLRNKFVLVTSRSRDVQLAIREMTGVE